MSLEIRQDGDDVVVSGTVVRYGDIARTIHGPERVSPGAFFWDDVVANRQHDRLSPLARTPHTLTLTDTETELFAEMRLPPTLIGRDTGLLIRRQVLQGMSAEFFTLDSDHVDGVHVIKRANLVGIGIVDRPAYPQSLVQARAVPIELRQLGNVGVEGEFPYGSLRVTSNAGVERKEQISPGAFTFSLEEAERDILAYFGGVDKPLASKLAGNLSLTDSDSALSFAISRLPNTSYARDMMALLDAGVVRHVIPSYITNGVPDATELVDEPDNEGVKIRKVNNAVLTSLVFAGRAVWSDTTLKRARRRRRWII